MVLLLIPNILSDLVEGPFAETHHSISLLPMEPKTRKPLIDWEGIGFSCGGALRYQRVEIRGKKFYMRPPLKEWTDPGQAP
jgi:hypothetical protein